MSPRKFDRFMVDVELSGNPKIGRLNDAEFRCLLSGVWPLAAKANPRGFLLVGPHPAEPEDVARQARCTVTVARRTLEKLRGLEMLERDEPTGWEWVHDWDEINPAPKPSDAPERTRDRKRKSRGGHADVTRDTADSHAPEVEVEGEVEEHPPGPPQAGGAATFPSRPAGNRKTALAEYEMACRAFITEHFPGTPDGLVAWAATHVRSRGAEPTAEALTPLIEQHTGGVAA